MYQNTDCNLLSPVILIPYKAAVGHFISYLIAKEDRSLMVYWLSPINFIFDAMPVKYGYLHIHKYIIGHYSPLVRTTT